MWQRHILEPIGMFNSFVADGAVHEAMATGHRPWFGTKRPNLARHPRPASAPRRRAGSSPAPATWGATCR